MAAALKVSAFNVLTRRSSGARDDSAAPSSARVIAEHAGEMRIEPFRIIAGDVRGRAGHVGGIETLAFVVAQSLGRVLRAVRELGDRLAVEPTLALEHAEQNRARACPTPMMNALDARRRNAS